MPDAMHRFVRVEFSHFKAFKTFSVDLKHFNILVGPNNAGKSTILVAFRILASAMRKAASKKPAVVTGPKGKCHGYEVDLEAISVAEENIFYNYDDTSAASVRFNLSNKSSLELFFPERGVCNLIADTGGRPAMTPSAFRGHFRCPIGFVPILGPVEHHEFLYEKEAAQNALFNYRAARNFRNIWHHYPEHFDEFRAALQSSWPGMDIEAPQVDMSYGKARLNMFCPEERIPRELFWAGFGFQVWCQMLTHLIQRRHSSIFLIDEPDIYLHSELQRQLIAYLRNLGPDILIATHSTEMVMEAEADDIVVISKQRRAGRRIRDPSQLEEVFSLLGSNTNPILTQLAKTKRALFVEGKDFQILGKLARRAGLDAIANRRDFAVVPVEGFSPDRIRALKAGMETTLGTRILAAAILDGDYRSMEERKTIAEECRADCAFVLVHECKEIENILLVPSALDRAASKRVIDASKRSGKKVIYEPFAEQFLSDYCSTKKAYVQAQMLAERRRFERSRASTKHESDANEIVLNEFDLQWQNLKDRLRCIPGKEAFSVINKALQDKYAVSLTPTAVLDGMLVGEMSGDVVALLDMLKQFSATKP
jgi:energy-coupling factor transporter ATP-binding protein EcfA2